MQYSALRIADILNVATPIYPDALIDVLLTDSRSLTYPERTLFFALTTPSGDGHRYVAELYRRGVRNFVVRHRPDTADACYTDANFFVVPDVRAALQQLARTHRGKFPSLPVIGITGSRGKTTLKEWLHHLLSPSIHTVRSPRSYNSQIGVPLSLWEITPDAELGIFEAGISEKGEMDALRDMIAPTIGVITNVASSMPMASHRAATSAMKKSNYSQHARKSYILSMIHCSPKEQHARFSPSAASP